MRKKTYAEMRSEGLCTICGKPNPTPTLSRCPECAKRARENRRRAKEYRAGIGICIRCGKNKAEPHKKMCYECLGKESDTYKSKGRTGEQREKDRERKRQLAEERRTAHICIRCGKHHTDTGGLCAYCRGKQKTYRDNNRSDIQRSERPDYGICYICGKQPIIEGKKVCSSCYGTRLETLPAMWENMNNEYFRQLEFARISMVRRRNNSVVQQ
jgi:hypothetical protein